jgi:acyl dehydratase
MQFGRCFEEFEVGAIYKHWPGRTITEYDDTLFCMITMNHHPLHIDANYAEETPYKKRVVVGLLVLSIAVGMSVPDVSGKAIANLEFENVKHLAPTFHGDTIYAETTVLDKKLSSSRPDRGVVTVETIAYNQHGEQVLSFKRRAMVPTRELDEAQQRAIEAKMQQRKRGPIL